MKEKKHHIKCKHTKSQGGNDVDKNNLFQNPQVVNAFMVNSGWIISRAYKTSKVFYDLFIHRTITW